MAEMQVRIGADVNSAVAGINKVNQSLTSLSYTIKQKGAAGFTVMGEAGQLAGSKLRSLSGVIASTASQVPALTTTVTSSSNSFKNFFAQIAQTQFGVIGFIGVVSLLGKGIFEAVTGANRLSSSFSLLAKAQREAAASTKDEVVQLQVLFAVAKDTSNSYIQRKAAIDQINKSYPQLHKNLSLETIGTEAVNNAIKDVINSLVAKAQVQNLVNTIAQLSNALDELKQRTSSGTIGNLNQKAIRLLTDRIDELTNSAIRLQGTVIGKGSSAGVLGGLANTSIGRELGRDIKEVKVPGLNIKPDKVEILKPRDLSFTSDFNFELARLFGKISKKKTGFDITGGSAGGTEVGDGFDEQKKIDNFNNLGNIITNHVTPAFQNFFDTIAQGGNAFKAFGQAVIQSLTGLISKLITTVALAAILSAVTGGVAGVGFQGASGFKAIFSSLLGFRAAGGPVGGGQPYVVGEQGRELFVPSTSGRIIPNNQLGGLSGSASPTILFNGRLAVSGNELKLLLNRTDRYQAANV